MSMSSKRSEAPIILEEEPSEKKMRKKQISPSKKWNFVWNNYDSSIVPDFLLDVDDGCLFEMQEEKAPTTGTIHLQGHVIFSKKVRPITFVGIKDIHWKKVYKDNGCQQYCMKDRTATGKHWSNMPKPVELIDPMKGLELKDWQKAILELIAKPPDHRKIYWLHEPDGNKGKTTFCKHLAIKHNALVISGKSADIKYAIAKRLEKKKPLPLVIMHITRQQENYVSYEAIESVKDGIFFSGKYESDMVLFNQPHVICFANFPPEAGKLSKDRWVIYRIDKPMVD